MNKTIILAIVAAAFSHAAIAADTVKPTKHQELKCPAGTKLVRGARIDIQKDGSGTLVEDDSCEPVETSADGFRVETPGDGFQ